MDRSKKETKRLTRLGYPPFNVFDTDDLGKPIEPTVWKRTEKHYWVGLKPDTDLDKFAQDADVEVVNTIDLKFADTSFGPGDKHDRGNAQRMVLYIRRIDKKE